MFKLHHHFFNSLEDILCDVEFIKTKKGQIGNVASVFDIEATSFYDNEQKRACMYAWVFGINGKCIRGRSWYEFEEVLNKVVEHYQLNTKKRLIVFVHNLSYEFQFIKFRFEWNKVFSVDNRKPVQCITNSGIEFRCSYILSNESLSIVGKNLIKYKVEKMVGDLDYSKIRHSSTPLSDVEWRYILNDGLVVMAYIQEEIEREGTIVDLPLTKTGYVRKYCREKCLKEEYRFEYYRLMRNLTLSPDQFIQLRQTYAGGFTHANSYKVGKTLSNVTSIDFTSSYPTTMLSEGFPMSKFVKTKIVSKEDMKDKLNKYCCMFEVEFEDIEPIFKYEHFISISKCVKKEDYVLDNGRVVEAGLIRLFVTEVDFKIIEKTYKWSKMKVGNFYIARKGYLPKPMIECVLKFYRNKTELKGIEAKIVEYLVSKGMLNSMYGMAVTDPCKDEICFSNDKDWYTEKGNLYELLNLYNNSRERFLFYGWGVWITCYAKYNLWTGILEFGKDYCYSDTDSLKVTNYEKHIEYINSYNEKITNKIKKCLRFYGIPTNYANPKTIKGVHKPLGVWDYEGEYKKFKTLGAKRYMYIDSENELHITIAGVSKSEGRDFLLHQYKNVNEVIKNFNEGLEFPALYDDNGVIKMGSGKNVHTYVDDYYSCYLKDYLGNESIVEEYSCMHIEPTSYNLGLDEIFKNYLIGINDDSLGGIYKC